MDCVSKVFVALNAVLFGMLSMLILQISYFDTVFLNFSIIIMIECIG